MEVKFETSMEFKEMTLKFLETYQIEAVFNNTISNKKQLKLRADRKCRYCGLSMPDVSFKKDAHMISEMLGNKSFFSDFLPRRVSSELKDTSSLRKLRGTRH